MSEETAAAKVAVPVSRLQEWEAGTDQPTIRQAQKLAKEYKRPFALFFLPDVPRDFQPLQDFRKPAPWWDENLAKTPTMSHAILYSRLIALPEHLKAEVADFINFLSAKHQKEESQSEASYPKPKFGSGKGMFVMHDDFDEPLEDFEEYMN